MPCARALFTGRNWLGSFTGHSVLPRHGYLTSLNVGQEELSSWWTSRCARWFCGDARVAQRTFGPLIGASGFSSVIARADLLLAGKMPLFSHHPVNYEGGDRWHRDHILNRVAPSRFYSQIQFLDAEKVGDCKHIWEPNRFSWALWLAIAYRLTNDRRYADKFAELASDWFSQNLYPIGVNYSSALEVALRAYAWTWVVHLLADDLASRPTLLGQLLEGIWISGRHVEENLSYYFSPNTHLTGEAFSLYACGAAFPEFAESARWRGLGERILAAEARRQFHDDGTHRELSSCYHLYSTDFYVHASLIARQTNCDIRDVVPNTARRLAERLAEMVPRNLILPQFNDCDGGRLTWICEDPLDAAPTLFAAVPLFGRMYFDAGERTECGYSLLMTPLPNNRQPQEEQRSPMIHFLDRDISSHYDSGIVTHRNVDGDYVLFRASPFGYMDCPHSHDAPLSFLLHLGGEPVVVDNGVGAYTQSLAIRNGFRAANGKNCLLVDGHGPSRVDHDWFGWKRKTECKLVYAERFAEGFRCRGKHAGFSSPPSFHVFIEREIFALNDGIVAVVDRWDADDEIGVSTRFTLDPRIQVDLAQGVLRLGSGRLVHLLVSPLDSSSPSAQISVDEIPYSPNYGTLSRTNVLICDFGKTQRGGCVTFLSRCGPLKATERPGNFRLANEYDTEIRFTPDNMTVIKAPDKFHETLNSTITSKAF